jgi:hypothetical protein
MDRGRQAQNRTVDEIEERKRKAAAVAIRFEQLTLAIASEHRFGGPDAVSTEIEIMEEATRLVKQSRGDKL